MRLRHRTAIGGCPGDRGDNLCSGITQNPWDFSHILEPFTG